MLSTPDILLSDSSEGMDSNFLNSLNLEFIALKERSPDFLTAGLYKTINTSCNIRDLKKTVYLYINTNVPLLVIKYIYRYMFAQILA